MNKEDSKKDQVPGQGDPVPEKEQRDGKGQKDKGQKHGKGKGKKDGRKNGRRDGGTNPRHNDWSWYAPTEQIAKDIANISFNTFPGDSFRILQRTYSGPDVYNDVDQIAYYENLMAIPYLQNMTARENNSSVNLAAKQLYTVIRRSNSGGTNYEPADLMMYILAVKDLYTWVFHVKRLFGVLSYYLFENRSVPSTVIRAYGLTSLEDAVSDFAQARGEFNLLLTQVNSLPLPKFIKAVLRSAYINSNIYADSTSVRSQNYMFIPMGYYTWNGTKYSTGTALEYHLVNTNLTGLDFQNDPDLTLSSYLNILRSMINSLIMDTDVATIMGDIIKCFGSNDLYQIAEIDYQYLVTPVYDEDVLNQIENMTTVLGRYLPTSRQNYSLYGYTNFSYDVKQENGLISSAMTFDAVTGTLITLSHYYLNSHKDDPQYTDALEWSRLMVLPSAKFSDTRSITGLSFIAGQEIPWCMTLITTYDNGGSFVIHPLDQFVTSLSVNVSSYHKVMQFDWHPFFYELNDGEFLVGGDTKVTAVVSSETLGKIHESAFYAMYFSRDLFSLGSATTGQRQAKGSLPTGSR